MLSTDIRILGRASNFVVLDFNVPVFTREHFAGTEAERTRRLSYINPIVHAAFLFSLVS